MHSILWFSLLLRRCSRLRQQICTAAHLRAPGVHAAHVGARQRASASSQQAARSRAALGAVPPHAPSPQPCESAPQRRRPKSRRQQLRVLAAPSPRRRRWRRSDGPREHGRATAVCLCRADAAKRTDVIDVTVHQRRQQLCACKLRRLQVFEHVVRMKTDAACARAQDMRQHWQQIGDTQKLSMSLRKVAKLFNCVC